MGVVECRSPHVPNSCSDEREDMYARVLSHGDVAKSPSMSSSIPDHVHPIPVRSDARIAYKWVGMGPGKRRQLWSCAIPLRDRLTSSSQS